MSDPSLGLVMLGLIVVAIMMGFPTAFTLMGLGMVFGYIAFWIPGQHWYDNRAFDLIVQRAYGVMTNDALLSIPLFVFMGYIMERAALVDKMFHSVQLAFRRVPASLAVTTMLVSAFWGIASGIVGAVVVLMGVIAMGPMLKAGYDVTAGRRHHHSGRHTRHSDSALRHAHRVRGGGGPVDREALRGRDAAGLLPDVPLPRLHPRAGRSSTRRSRPSCRPTSIASPCPSICSGSSAGAAGASCRRSSPPRSVRRSQGAGAEAGYRRLQRDRQEPARPLGAATAHRRHVRRRVVVRRHLQRRPAGGRDRAADRRREAGGPSAAPPTASAPVDRRAPADEKPQEVGLAGEATGDRGGQPAERSAPGGDVVRADGAAGIIGQDSRALLRLVLGIAAVSVLLLLCTSGEWTASSSRS